MPLGKAIEHNKEKRKPYYRSKRFDRSCRNHGSCGYCLDNRLHGFRKAEPIVFDEEFELNEEQIMTEQKTYEYSGHTMEYSVDDTSFFKYSTTIQLGNKEEDYVLLAANTEQELIQDFQERVDQFLVLKQQLVDEVMILSNFVKQKFNDTDLNAYLKTRLILAKEQLRKLTNEI